MPKVSWKFLKNPRKSLAISRSDVAVGVPVEKPVPTGCSTLFELEDIPTDIPNIFLPKHIGQVYPGVLINDRLCSTWIPQKLSIFLEEAVQRRTTWASIQPYGDLVDWIPDL